MQQRVACFVQGGKSIKGNSVLQGFLDHSREPHTASPLLTELWRL